MAKSVFIFGAGASKPGGVPVMNDFIDEGLALNEQNKIQSGKNFFDLINSALNSLHNSLYSNIYIDLENIQDICFFHSHACVNFVLGIAEYENRQAF